MTEEIKHEEHKEHSEHKTEIHHAKEKFDFKKWVKGSSTREYIENVSFVIILVSAIMVSSGIGLGSFIQGTIVLAILGSFFVMIGIVIYIISQFIEVEHG